MVEQYRASKLTTDWSKATILPFKATLSLSWSLGGRRTLHLTLVWSPPEKNIWLFYSLILPWFVQVGVLKGRGLNQTIMKRFQVLMSELNTSHLLPSHSILPHSTYPNLSIVTIYLSSRCPWPLFPPPPPRRPPPLSHLFPLSPHQPCHT